MPKSEQDLDQYETAALDSLKRIAEMKITQNLNPAQVEACKVTLDHVFRVREWGAIGEDD